MVQMIISLSPVSYTHLDVYKRQVLVTVTNSEKFSAFHLEQEVGEKVEALSEVITFKKGE